MTFAALRGGSRPRDVALGLSLGLLAGFVAGWNYTFVALLVLAALVNLSTRWMLAAGCAASLVSVFASPWIGRLGRLLLDELRLGKAIAWLGDSPAVAMLDWDRYRLVGGVAIALVLSVPAIRAAYVFAAAASDNDTAARGPLFRPAFWLIAPLVLVAGGIAPWMFRTRAAVDWLFDELSAANGAQVSAERVSLSLWTGELEIDGLSVPDPSKLDHDRLRIGTLRCRLDPGLVLRQRLHAEHVLLENIDRDVQRASAARGKHQLPTAFVAKEGVHQAANSTQSEIDLHEHLRHWDRFTQKLDWMQRVIVACEWVAGLDAPRVDAGPAINSLASDRSPLGMARPRVVIDLVEAERLGPAWGLGSRAKLMVTQLQSHPTALDRPTTCRVVVPSCAAEVVVDLDWHKSGLQHAVSLKAYNLPLSTMLDPRGRLRVANGAISLVGSGVVDSQRVDLRLQVDARGVEGTVVGEETIGGLTPEFWNRALASLSDISEDVHLVGRWTEPRLRASMNDVVTQLRHQLRAAGAHELVAQLEAERSQPPRTTTHAPAVEGPSQPQAPQSKIAVLQRLPPVGDVPMPPSPAIERLPAIEAFVDYGPVVDPFLGRTARPAAALPPSPVVAVEQPKYQPIIAPAAVASIAPSSPQQPQMPLAPPTAASSQRQALFDPPPPALAGSPPLRAYRPAQVAARQPTVTPTPPPATPPRPPSTFSWLSEKFQKNAAEQHKR
jgi:uncharacterized protein (TIGR03546 family)